MEREELYQKELSRIEREVLEDKEQLVQDVVQQVGPGSASSSFEFLNATFTGGETGL